ncbi:MAG: PilC/PilY family type IV pilus protein [Aquisalimonadaceae bacterium]
MNKKSGLFQGFSGILLLAFAAMAQAEDIELFMMDPSITGDRPNVLLIIDNQSNWSASNEWPGQATKQERIEEAVREVLLNRDDLIDQINLGILNIGSGSRQARVIERVQLFDDSRRVAGASLRQRIDEMDGDGDYWKASNSDYGMLMNEAYLYFSGDRASSNSGSRDDAAIDSSGNYISPSASACAKNYVIFIGTGFPQNDHKTNARNALAGHGGDTSMISLNPNRYEESWADEFARFMSSSNAEPSINSFVIDVFNPARSNAGMRAFWQSIAHQGKGDYYSAETVDDLVEALTMSFDSILAVNSVFAASSLPVSVNVRGTNLNQVYMGVFRPDAEGKPRWMGNLKLYQLSMDDTTGQVYLAGVDEERADSPITGFIREQANSFWTYDDGVAFWDGFDMEVYRHAHDLPDGDIVEKGGVAQQLRNNWGSRRLLTCDIASCTGAPDDFTAATTGLDSSRIEWLRGEDNWENENPNDKLSNVRPSIHGDVLHSRPAVLNYAGDTDIVVFYGSNDGVFRAIRGGPGSGGGEELWGFVPPEFHDKLEILYDNDETVLASSTGKPYFMDGGIGTYFENDASGDITEAWIFPSMRRGGRAIYAFDVSDYDNPQILWRRSHEDTGFEELGQTWSEPRVAKTLANGGNPVLIFGAGYDAAYEDQADRTGSATMGRGIFVVDAENGNIIWEAGPDEGMVHSIPSDVTLISRGASNRQNGITDRLYVGDTGGNVWRIDLDSSNTSEWSVHKLAALNDADEDIKFLYPPDVVYENGYEAVIIGSGDREKPHDLDVQNAFFMLKDTGGTDTITLADLYDATENLIQDGTDQQAELDALEASDGWVMYFAEGEKNVGSAVTLNNTTFFSTHQPQAAVPGSCVSNLGIARNYAMSYKDATATREQDGQEGLSRGDRAAVVAGGGFIPSPVPVIVDVNGQLRELVLRGTQVGDGGDEPLNRRWRTYWYTEID